jgi:hypothetical protein
LKMSIAVIEVVLTGGVIPTVRGSLPRSHAADIKNGIDYISIDVIKHIIRQNYCIKRGATGCVS